MLAPAKPANEQLRLDTLCALNILDTEPEERFDRLTRIARRLFKVPVALVSLVDANRQWFKSAAGLELRETPRDISFCAHAILNDQLFIIPDARNDARFFDNPLVTGPQQVRFYAGCPLRATNGSVLGTFCLLDQAPRQFDPQDQGLLLDLAAVAEQELQAQQLASVDHLTQVANRRGFEAVAGYALGIARRLGTPASLLFFDLNGFKAINDQFGHEEGDKALAFFARTLRGAVRGMDSVGRLGGDEFVVLLMGTPSEESQCVIERLEQLLAEHNRLSQTGYEIRYSVGVVEYEPMRHESVQRLLADADARMYAHKQAQRRP